MNVVEILIYAAARDLVGRCCWRPRVALSVLVAAQCVVIEAET